MALVETIQPVWMAALIAGGIMVVVSYVLIGVGPARSVASTRTASA